MTTPSYVANADAKPLGTHEFFGMGAAVADARAAQQRAGKGLKMAFKVAAKPSRVSTR